MALLNTCDPPSAAEVTLQVMLDECGCPGDLPVNPVKFATFDAGSRQISEDRTEVEDPNAYGGTCYKSTSDGASSSTPQTLSFCRNQRLTDAALGTKTIIGPKVVLAAIDGIAPNIYRHASIDFWAAGFRPGMVLTSSGFTDAAYNGKKVIVSVTAEGVFPSEIAFYTNADISDYPAATANETDETDITLDAGYITYAGNEAPNIITERGFPGVTNESGNPGLFQYALGGVVESYSETYEWGQFASGQIDISYSVWNGSAAASLGSLGGEDDCVCNEKIFLDPNDGRIIEAFWNGRLICFNTANFTISRPVDRSKNSCGTAVSPGKSGVTGTFEVPFTETQFLEDVRDKVTGPLLFLIWNSDRSVLQTRLLPDATLSQENVDPDDETQLTQEVTFRGNNDPDVQNSAIIVQRNLIPKQPPRNRFECTFAVVVGTDAAKEVDLIGNALGETIHYDWGDGTTGTIVRDATTETLTRTYSANGTYTAVFWGDGDEPWTDIVVDTAGDVLTAPQLCYLREYVDGIILNFGGTELELENYIVLASVEIISTTLTSLLFPNTPISNLDLGAATGMLAAGWDSVLQQLVDSNVINGTADLTGGAATPTAAGLANKSILEARGWTVTVNT